MSASVKTKIYYRDSAQNAPDARREISEERGVLIVRRSDEEIEATQQMGYFQWNQFIIYMSLLITISLCGLCCLSGCKDKTTAAPVAPSITKKSTAINSKKIKGFQARLEHLMEPVTYHYSSEGKPDPFQPFLKTAQKVSRRAAKKRRQKKEVRRPEICATPLECMDVGQLTLVGIIANDKGNRIAMAQDAAGIGYFLQPGLRVGYRNGRVKKILPDRVIVEEELEDIRGELTLQKRILLLHPEGK